ncbi:SDR family oxidoreductase [Thalassospira marina]|uniref:Short chain dehydrogenase n=1 Tax=Thalassospira marina TaxID=2048283 RepID=A0ABM6QEZ6_9PROT|nr:SDR family oxidoreductase [Thalassospira marina]AUG55117.1 short chain dehydrogenase [Thalassospira marina]
MQNLENQNVLVVGGSSGIGLASAKTALAAGANVTIASRSKAKLEAALAELQNDATPDQRVAIAVLDTGDNDAVNAFFAGNDAWDHIVVSAAQTPTGPVRGLSLADARQAMESKFWGAYHIARAAKLTDNASLTLVTGFLAERPSTKSVMQGAINAALDGLTRGLALELAPVRVNAVSPGLIVTPLWDRVGTREELDKLFASAAESLPVKRVGQPQDIANAIHYLMITPFATGTTVRVDGGGVIA